MHKFSYNMFNELEIPTVILSTKYHKHLGTIRNIDKTTINCNFNMASAQELSFDVYKTLDGIEEPLWDSIVNFKYIYLPEHKEYYSIEVSIDDTDNTVKHITGTSACEFELSGRILYDFECNTESDILQDDYVVTKFYDHDNPRGSLLDRVLADKCPDYTIGHVDVSLWDIQRTFSVNGTSVYNFLAGTVAEEIECLFVFDSVNRIISAYDLKFVCDSCNYRGDLSATCPNCGSSEYHSRYGETTNIFISAENYAEQITCSGNLDNVFNCLKISGGDDVITTALMYINPNGSQYIYNFNEETLADMPEELVDKIASYNELYDSVKDEYAEVSTRYYNAVDEKAYLEHTMMPKVTTPTTDAQTEADNLPTEFAEFGDVAVSNGDTLKNLSETSANLAIQGMAKVLVDARYNVKVDGEISGLDPSQTRRTWTGTVVITNKGDDEDTAPTTSFSVQIVGNDYEEYMHQRILKQLDRDDSTFYNLFEIEDIHVFETELDKYCKERLSSFYQSYETCLNVLIENGVTDKNAVFYDVDLYNEMYLPYKERLDLIQKEIKERDDQIALVDNAIAEARTHINEIHEQLDFKKYISSVEDEEDLWLIFCHYRKESTYSNENYISDGLDNGEVIAKAKELFEVCEKEVKKSSQIQYTLTSNLNNLLNTKEFAPYKDKLTIGNWITMKSDEKLYYLRLINIGFNYGSPEQITVSFSDAERINNVINDTQSIFAQLKNIAGSYDTVKHQASQGDKVSDDVTDWMNNGLNSALIAIKNNNNEEITYDQNGLLARSYDDILDEYSPKQFKLTHNVMAFTHDNWVHLRAVVGETTFTVYDANADAFVEQDGYGVLAEFLQAPKITGAEIVGGDIYSTNYSSNNNTGSVFHLNDGTFSYAGGKLKYDGTNLDYIGNLTMTGGNLTVKDDSTSAKTLFKADVTNHAVNIGGFTVKDDAIYNGTNAIDSTTNGIYLGTNGIRSYENGNLVNIKNGILKANSVDVSGTISGSNIIGSQIENGNGFKVNSVGYMESKSGNIGGWSISSKRFESEGYYDYLSRGEYTEDDLARVRYIIDYGVVPTEPELYKYDIDSDGVITERDYNFCKNIYIERSRITTTTYIETWSPDYTIKLINNGDPEQGLISGDLITTLSPFGINTSNIRSIDNIFNNATIVTADIHILNIGDINNNYKVTRRLTISAAEGVGLYKCNGFHAFKDQYNNFNDVYAANFVQQSSKLVKTNILTMTESEANKILDVNVVTFDYKEKFGGQKDQRGVIAEEVKDIIPSAVTIPDGYNEDDFDEDKGTLQPILGIDYSKFVPYLIKKVQMQEDEIKELKNIIKTGKDGD